MHPYPVTKKEMVFMCYRRGDDLEYLFTDMNDKLRTQNQ